MFNRRRSEEVSKMKLSICIITLLVLCGRQTWTNISFYSRFDSNLLWKVLKYKAKVPVLLTKSFVQQLECLIKNWGKANVSESNEYIFNRSNSENHFRGSDVIRKYSKECGADSPDTLRSKYLRKHVATISQITNLRDKKLDLLAQFMGHDIRIHCEYYRLMFCWLGHFGQTLYYCDGQCSKCDGSCATCKIDPTCLVGTHNKHGFS